LKNILNENDRNSLIDRIKTISEDDKALWGKMTVNEMVCHTTDQLKMAMDEIKTDYIGNMVKSTLLKQLVLLGMPVPKGKIETVKELKQGVGGTPPVNFRDDIASLKSTINKFVSGTN
jgi:hypothetical protein